MSFKAYSKELIKQAKACNVPDSIENMYVLSGNPAINLMYLMIVDAHKQLRDVIARAEATDGDPFERFKRVHEVKRAKAYCEDLHWQFFFNWSLVT